MLKDAVKRLFDTLEEIGDAHEELYDTDVREQLAETLDFAFVSGHRLPSTRLSYGMFSVKGDVMVADAVLTFLKEALPAAAAEGIAVGVARHSALQDASIVTNRQQHYDSFIGHSDSPLNCKELPARRFGATEKDP